MTKSLRAVLALTFLSTVVVSGTAEAAGLRGSPASMVHQHAIAVEHDFLFARTPAQVEELVEKGKLVQLNGNADYALSNVSFPFARPEIELFVERLARQYRDATGTKLVVTSLTRPLSLQPRNAHDLSVHPAGMAVDLRVPADSAQRAWLEGTLLALEEKGLLDVTREHYPPHYHVAVFPDEYGAYAAKRQAEEAALAAKEAAEAARAARLAAADSALRASTSRQAAGATGAAVLLGFAGVAGLVAVPRRRRRRRRDDRQA